MNKKFTLIELIIVIAILGILASLVIPNISSFKGDATTTSTVSNVRNFQTSIDMYSLKNNGEYPTIVQPSEFIPQPIDFNKLDKKYIKTLPKTTGVKYWVDFQGKVWASTVDAPKGVKNENGNITWQPVEGAIKYQVFELQGYQGIISTIGKSKANLVFKTETTNTSYIGESNKHYVITAFDNQEFQSAPSGVGYTGYVSPINNNDNKPPTNGETQSTIPENKTPEPIQTTVPQDYIGIYTLEDLNNVRNNLSGKYILMKNLDFNKNADYTNIADKTTWTTGSGWEPVGYGNTPFTGTFDGNGLSISNLYINRGVTDYVGLFGRTTNGSTIKNVSVLNANITGGNYTGILIGEATSTNINNVFTSGNAIGISYVGGVIGQGSGTINIAGSSANVTGTKYQIGGLIGLTTSTITNAYTTGNISGNVKVGGLVGHQNANITNAYSTGKVTATGINPSYIGGLVGHSDSGTTTNSYWNTETSGYATSGAGTQLNGNSIFLKEKFIGFDFATIWDMQEGTTMPYLRGLPIPENVKKANITGKYIPFAGGKGTISDPYLISTEQQLNNIRNELYASYKLTNNITLTSYQNGSGWEPIGYGNTPFTGTFDGNGLSISNLYINRGVTDYVGLFGRTTNGSTIKNVSVLNANITGGNYTGILIGEAISTNINNVFTSGNVVGITNVGGVIGKGSGTINIAGSSANVTGTKYQIGGLIGLTTSTITNAYTTGNISGNVKVGGLVGHQNANITNAYSTGKVTATGTNPSYIGGLVGYMYGGTTTNSYWNTETSGYATSGAGTQLNGSSIFLKENFTGFDFATIWDMQEGTTMPYLRGLPIPENVKKANITGQYIPFAGGKGTSTDPYLISTEQQLNNIRNELYASYKLTNNITLTSYQNGSGWEPIGYGNTPFVGTFDGNGLTISNLYISKGTTDYIGLFGQTANGSTIKNVSVLNANITGGNYTGILIGEAISTNINNVFTSGNVVGITYVGGVIGKGSGTINIAGSSANVTGSKNTIGGLIGLNTSTITNAYATGNISGNVDVGGLVGRQSANITNTYSTGKVTATGTNPGYIGGLVGYKYNGTTTNSYWNTETSGYATSGTGTGKTTIQMKQQATYVGWDFTNTWTINEGNDYPKLR